MSAVISGIRWAAKKGADIINLSLGGNSGSAALEESLEFCKIKGFSDCDGRWKFRW